MADPPTHDLAAAFTTEADALEALHDIEGLALGPHAQVVLHHAGDHEDLRVAEVRLIGTVERAMLVGLPIGALAGVALMAATAAVEPGISRAMVIGVGLVAGAICGLLFGGVVAIAWRSREIEEAETWERSHRCEQEVLVARLDDEAMQRRVTDRSATAAVAVPEEIRRIFSDHHGHPLQLSVEH